MLIVLSIRHIMPLIIAIAITVPLSVFRFRLSSRWLLVVIIRRLLLALSVLLVWIFSSRGSIGWVFSRWWSIVGRRVLRRLLIRTRWIVRWSRLVMRLWLMVGIVSSIPLLITLWMRMLRIRRVGWWMVGDCTLMIKVAVTRSSTCLMTWTSILLIVFRLRSLVVWGMVLFHWLQSLNGRQNGFLPCSHSSIASIMLRTVGWLRFYLLWMADIRTCHGRRGCVLVSWWTQFNSTQERFETRVGW